MSIIGAQLKCVVAGVEAKAEPGPVREWGTDGSICTALECGSTTSLLQPVFLRHRFGNFPFATGFPSP